MKDKFIDSALVVAFLVGNLPSGRAQTSSPPMLPPPQGAVIMRTGGEMQGFQFVGGEASRSTQVVKGAPYSLEATIETAQTLADGNRIVHRQTVQLYRDTKGRTRREETLAAIGPWAASDTPPTMITIQDPASGVGYFLDPQLKVANKLPSLPSGKNVMFSKVVGSGPVTSVSSGSPGDAGFISSSEEGPQVLMGFHAEPGGQVRVGPEEKADEKSESLGRENIAGIAADGTRTTTTIPANAIGNERAIDIVRERWYSPDLQIVLRSKQEDPRFGETTYEVTKLNRTEPSSSLFEVPSDYKINKAGPQVIKYHTETK